MSSSAAVERIWDAWLPGDSLVLVVEDNDAVRQLTVTRLKHLGYRVAEASNGVQAIEMLKGGLQPALVFSDAVMPGGISGRELLERAATILPSVKTLMTSGYSEDFINLEGRTSRTFGLLPKPHRLAELADAVRAALGQA